MRRQWLTFDCAGETLHAALDLLPHDSAQRKSGLLIVSGGNEILSGAHRGQAQLAAKLAGAGYPVMRFDRRGVGDSSGRNGGFLQSQADIASALQAFREHADQPERVFVFGNCDAATALTLFQKDLAFDGLILANPWTFDTLQDADKGSDDPSLPSPAAIRARYWKKLKDPKAVTRLLSGHVDLKKLGQGLRKAGRLSGDQPDDLGTELADALSALDCPTTILLAEKDRTAAAFMELWQHPACANARNNRHIHVRKLASGSHSFADPESAQWLLDTVLQAMA